MKQLIATLQETLGIVFHRIVFGANGKARKTDYT